MQTRTGFLGRWTGLCISILLIARLLAPTGLVRAQSPIPILAYYYIWFNQQSWDRAKTDYPILGRYSSDDEAVMRQHIQWAKAAGISGFIVSWKDTIVLTTRLETLARVAAQENFKLSIIYQGLDFDRDPLPVDRVAEDLDYFIAHFASSPVFDQFGKPVVIWSGSWKFTTDKIAEVTGPRREQLLILASEKSAEDYQLVAPYFDGDAYYWSSVNPETNTRYQTRLNALADAVHQNFGLWIAPAAPGFDARLVGGTSVVERKSGDTLRTELGVAMQSSPDAVGVISWNEFSENTHIEPSLNYGRSSLEALANFNNLPPPKVADFDSSEPARTIAGVGTGGKLAALGGLVILFLVSILMLIRRQHVALDSISQRK